MRSQLAGIILADVFQHGTPYLALHRRVGLLELNLEDEATLEGTVEVTREVGGGNENTVKVLYLLQDDVLHGIVHLLYRGVVATIGATHAEDAISLVEEEDRGQLGGTADVAIAGEDGMGRLGRMSNSISVLF